MNIERIKAMLEQSAEQQMELAANLGRSNGRQLTMRDKQLIRAATLPVIQDICEGMLINHLQGIAIDADQIVNEIRMISID